MGLFHHQTSHLLIPKDRAFLKQGEVPNKIGFVLQGLMKVEIPTPHGSVFIKDFLETNDPIASYSAMIHGIPSAFNYIAIEDTELLILHYSDLLELYNRHICWHEVGRKTVENILFQYEKREIDLLIFPPMERYEKFQRERKKIITRLKQSEIAAYLGITPESLSRLTRRKHTKMT